MDQFSNRRYFLGGVILIVYLIIIGKLFMLQVIDASYKYSADNNSQRIVVQFPARGLIFDRNQKLLVSNKAAYDLMVEPLQLKAFDTASLSRIIQLEKKEIHQLLVAARRYSKYKPSIVAKQLSAETYAILQEHLYRFPGFYVQPRTLRQYEYKGAAHVLGFVGEVDEKKIEQDPYYKQGDYAGILGIERSYESIIRGEKGYKIYVVDVHNRIKGSFQEGKYDKKAVLGADVTVGLDFDIQQYGELLMQNKIGSVVAIEPNTGEILTLISSPGYDPSVLIGRERSVNYQKLERDELKPLFNRALMANYPPGSTFKLANALIAVEENLINKGTKFSCSMGWRGGPVFVGCHDHPAPQNLPGSIQVSCNSYYCNVFKKIMTETKYNRVQDAYLNWRNHITSFGFGNKLGCDFMNELRGFVPTENYYNKYYGERGWSYLTIISLAIGQGEILATPIQMANFAATIANRGYYYTPHIVKNINGNDTILDKYQKKHVSTIQSKSFDNIIEGMYMAVNGPPGVGSTARIAQIKDWEVCGKTGTAQNPHGEDHSIFIAFAPKDNPKIAIAVFVENAGFGATYAAPIASLIMEKYLTDSIANNRKWIESHIIETNLISHDAKNKHR